MRQFNSAAAVIDAIGGPAKFARWYGKVEPNAVTMWRTRGFPAKTFPRLAPRLRKEQNIVADPRCWPHAEAA
jgi:hypothetical protein